MKLYRFYIDNNSLVRAVLDVEEKPKTYTVAGCDWRQRIAKEDIGAVDCRKRVHLLEDDKKKAIDILTNYYNSKIYDENSRHATIMEGYRNSLEVLNVAKLEESHE